MEISVNKLKEMLGNSKNSIKCTKSRGKYGNIRSEVNGIKFPSKLEASVYNALNSLQKEGKVKFFLRQVPFDLPGPSKHIVDYCIFTHENVIFIEAKGMDLPIGKLKRKQVEDLFKIRVFVVKNVGEVDALVSFNG